MGLDQYPAGRDKRGQWPRKLWNHRQVETAIGVNEGRLNLGRVCADVPHDVIRNRGSVRRCRLTVLDDGLFQAHLGLRSGEKSSSETRAAKPSCEASLWLS